MSNTSEMHNEIQDSLRSRHKVSPRAKEIPIRRFLEPKRFLYDGSVRVLVTLSARETPCDVYTVW